MSKALWRGVLACWLGLGMAVVAAEESDSTSPGSRRVRGKSEMPSGRQLGQARAARTRRGPLAHLEEMLDQPGQAEALGVTPEQVASLKSGLSELSAQRTTLVEALQAAGTEQARLMTAEDLDEAAVLKVVEEAGRLRTEMAKLHARQLILARQTFTEEQMQQIRSRRRQKMQEQRQEHRRQAKRDKMQGRDRQRQTKGEGDAGEALTR